MLARLCAAACTLSLAACSMLRHEDAADYQPRINAADFQTQVDNPWFPLVPGTTYRYVERKGAERTDVVTTVTHETRTIRGVTCVVVHDLATRNGATLEDTYDWYAQDKKGNVWYFGEDTRAYDANGKYSTEGSWEAGVDGAQPGIVMPADAVAGAAYRQEYFAGHAEDMGQIVTLNESVSVPLGVFVETLRTREWSELEAGSDKKWYARGIGFIRSEAEDGDVGELISMSKAP